MFEIKQKDSASGRVKTIKADRTILQRVIIAYHSGRAVDIDKILTHQLFVVPLSLAQVNEQLRSGQKAALSDVFISAVDCPEHLESPELGDDASLIVDGQALVMALGKPKAATTFGDLADAFVENVFQNGLHFKRFDVLF